MTNLAAAPGIENPTAMVDYASAAVLELRDGGSGPSGFDVRFGFRNGSETDGLAYYPLFGTDQVDMDLETFQSNLEVRRPLSLSSPAPRPSSHLLLALAAAHHPQQHRLVHPLRQQRLGRRLLGNRSRPVVRGPRRQVQGHRRRPLYERRLGLHRRVRHDRRRPRRARLCVALVLSLPSSLGSRSCSSRACSLTLFLLPRSQCYVRSAGCSSASVARGRRTATRCTTLRASRARSRAEGDSEWCRRASRGSCRALARLCRSCNAVAVRCEEGEASCSSCTDPFLSTLVARARSLDSSRLPRILL